MRNESPKPLVIINKVRSPLRPTGLRGDCSADFNGRDFTAWYRISTVQFQQQFNSVHRGVGIDLRIFSEQFAPF